MGDWFDYKGVDLHFFAMEYVHQQPDINYDRQSLNDLVERMQPLAQALAYAHDLKVIHRDIKPKNIMVDDSGKPKLLDFGLARILEMTHSYRLTREKVIMGTPYYMAPEQFHHAHHVDNRADIYSLAAVMHQWMTGKLPVRKLEGWSYHRDRSMAQLREAFQDVETTIDFSGGLHLDSEIERICRKALAVEPHQRYASGKEFAEDLRLYADIRRNSRRHFFKLASGSQIPLDRARLFIHLDADISISNRESDACAELIFFGGSYELYIKRPLEINHRQYGEGNLTLHDGDVVRIGDREFAYKKIGG